MTNINNKYTHHRQRIIIFHQNLDLNKLEMINNKQFFKKKTINKDLKKWQLVI